MSKEITYRTEGDYLIPNLYVEPDNLTFGVWAHRRNDYLKEHKNLEWYLMHVKGTLRQHLADTERAAKDMLELLVDQMVEEQGITEALNRENPMEWVGRMNNIYASAREIVFAELIYI